MDARLGRAGPSISRLGIGGWQASGSGPWGAGPRSDDRAAIAAIRHAVERGVTWVDTAASYGLGHSEEVVARALEPWRVGDEVLVFTKCGHPWDPPHRIRTDLSPASIRRECEGSLRRLGVERIDLYQFHHADPSTEIEDSWSTMEALVAEGKVRWAGLSNVGSETLARCEPILHVDSLQLELSLLHPTALDVLPWCVDNGTGVIAYSPLASGLLTGTYDRARIDAMSEDDPKRSGLDRALAIVPKVGAIAERHRLPVAAIAVAWVLAQSGVTGAICGARTAAQIDGWIDAADVAPTDSDLADLRSG
jgi:aryl-alcohol dehydrogenase-like predicted oxidoreductase